ncbi:arylamine N-acetyltransferase family protein [Streptosporangium roseum]|uniref:N-acetyltransferase n=1 Tax=Streptosporangium roseum (strain ATCC 12428 / DSM 43021 / JCM 3005 / KCTC 9067 / NCIMB 10171 / NRRL 2505 / NI 9100) TaxID=479432 RepID=D2AUQ7_STRRD|nr:arylamine N-acetyltransferase [Streptosporangium roseum]ACZ84919.1 N-acetyltransferase [Streptosporangium roseum DSM 43021]
MDEYLKRIGAARPAGPDAESLRELQLRHLLTVPFENLSVHLGEPVVLDDQALVEKVVGRRRGGFCYELNGAFALLLRSLGYQVTLLAARPVGDGSIGSPFDHLALRVNTPDPWLVDVGFGAFSHHPLRLDLRADQPDPAGVFRVAETADGDLDVLKDGVLEYRLEQRPRVLADFEPTCWWHQTSPRSHFTRSLVCSLLTDAGRVTLSDRLLIHTSEGGRREQRLSTDAETLAAYRDLFGIELTRLPPAPPRSGE